MIFRRKTITLTLVALVVWTLLAGTVAADLSRQAQGPAEYMVRRGDTLAAIAASHGTTVSAVLQANHLTSYQIRPGQRLVIPEPARAAEAQPIDGAGQHECGGYYTVVSGDSLATIAQRNGLAREQLMAANGLVRATIFVGQVLAIPCGGDAAQVVERASSDDEELVWQRHYVVQAGDTLATIAAQHGVTVVALKDANKLKDDRIFAGQALRVPQPIGNATPAGRGPIPR